MSIVVTITAGGTPYDVSDYVIRHSIEIDEYLFSPDSLRPNTNKATLTLSRTCPNIDEILAASGDISISIVADGVAAFSGYLTDNFGIKITATGAGDMAITAEDPGIKLLKKPWESADGLSTNLSGKKVCDPADTGNSFVHILAGLAGVTVASGAPTISNLVYFSIQDKDKKQYWDVLEKVLADFGYVFYFDASGELAFYSLAALTGTPSLVVRSDATILQQTPGDAGIEIKKRFIQYQETVVKYKEAQTLASAVIFRDTTNQGLTDCNIEIAAGGYYPSSADASTYAYIDYFLEDGRDILAVGSATADFSLDSGITYEFDHLGKSARIRFYNPTALPKSIRKLKVTGSSVIAVKAESSMTSNEGGGKKLEYQADYLTANADAQSLANLLRYVYANSTSLYTFRSYQGVLYPADTLYPSDTLYPLGDTLTLGSLVNLLDPVWTSLDVDCAIYRKKYKVGKAGATFEALGIGTINLSAATARRPVAVPDARPIVGLYPTEKALASTSDAVDFDGQYGVYLGQRYVGAKPTTWTLDDAGQTATDVAALVPTYTPAYLGALDADPSTGMHESDFYYRKNTTPKKFRRYASGTWGDVATSDTLYSFYLGAAMADMSALSLASGDDGFAFFGGIAANSAFFTALKAVSGFFDNITVTGKATLSECVLSDITSGDNLVKSSDTEITVTHIDTFTTALQICASGVIKIKFDVKTNGAYNVDYLIMKNDAGTGLSGSTSSTSYVTITNTLTIAAGDIIKIRGVTNTSPQTGNIRNFRISIDENPGILRFL